MPAAYQPRKPDDLHVGYGVRLDAGSNTEQSYTSDPAAWVHECLTTFGGRAPVECLLLALKEDGYFSPEDVLFDAMNDADGGFAFYPL